MFNLSGSELVFLLLLALIVLGPEKLPEAVRKFGRVYSELKKMSTGFQSELKSALDEPMREMRETAEVFKKAVNFDFNDEGGVVVKDEAQEPAEPPHKKYRFNDEGGLIDDDDAETAAVDPPVVETPVVDSPVVDTPVVETPVVETPVLDSPVVDSPVVDTPVVDAPPEDGSGDELPVIDPPEPTFRSATPQQSSPPQVEEPVEETASE